MSHPPSSPLLGVEYLKILKKKSGEPSTTVLGASTSKKCENSEKVMGSQGTSRWNPTPKW